MYTLYTKVNSTSILTTYMYIYYTTVIISDRNRNLKIKLLSNSKPGQPMPNKLSLGHQKFSRKNSLHNLLMNKWLNGEPPSEIFYCLCDHCYWQFIQHSWTKGIHYVFDSIIKTIVKYSDELDSQCPPRHQEHGFSFVNANSEQTLQSDIMPLAKHLLKNLRL